jgi:cyclic pyranopterin phosphate synthase
MRAEPYTAGEASAATAPMIDPFGRTIRYLRVSVTDRCDLRCTYCMAEHMTFLPKRDLLSLEELDRLCAAFIGLGVRKLRLTGGEPLLRKGLLTPGGAPVAASRPRPGRAHAHHQRHAARGARGGVGGARRAAVNVSLDTLDPARFRRLTRGGDLSRVLAGLDAAQAAGLRVKINTVALGRWTTLANCPR